MAEALADTGAFAEDTKAPIERFIDLVHSLRQGFEAGSAAEAPMARLVDLVAGDLLTTLNALTAAVSTTLNARIGARRAQNEQSRTAMLKAISSINDVSLKVKLISLNASIEAALAGPYGKSFGVIAAEIRTLSEDAARSAKGLLEQMDRPA
ncbi:Methyl-accepting chemotaxis protein IV [compost metagenome]